MMKTRIITHISMPVKRGQSENEKKDVKIWQDLTQKDRHGLSLNA